MWFYILTVLILACTSEISGDNDELIVETRHFTTSQIIAEYGYTVANYFLKTKDGYLLQIFRIPHGEGDDASDNKERPVVLLLPGLYCSSYFYFFYQNQSLPLQLADAGYDVWIGDFRGQADSEAYGQYPTTFGPKGWKFSMDEMAKYDVPAFIDFILSKTGQSKLSLVGHSMGNTVFFMTLASKPEYNQKVDKAIALAPGVYVAPHTGPNFFLTTSFITRTIWEVLNAIGLHRRQQPSGWEVRLLGRLGCPANFGREYCRSLLFKVLGKDYDVPLDVIPIVIEQISSASYMTFRQYLQHQTTERFAMYDYGEKENQKRYNSKKPPLYNLAKVTTSVALISGKTDGFNKDINVKFLAKKLPNVFKNYYVDKDQFNHFSFVADKNIQTLVNEPVIKLIKGE